MRVPTDGQRLPEATPPSLKELLLAAEPTVEIEVPKRGHLRRRQSNAASATGGR